MKTKITLFLAIVIAFICIGCPAEPTKKADVNENSTIAKPDDGNETKGINANKTDGGDPKDAEKKDSGGSVGNGKDGDKKEAAKDGNETHGIKSGDKGNGRDGEHGVGNGRKGGSESGGGKSKP